MKGQYDEFGWVKTILVIVFVFGIAYIFISQYGMVNIELTGSREISKLKEWNVECNKRLDAKCNPCPIVKCVGDMSFPMFILGMFFGFIGGALFTMHFGNKFREEFKKQLEKVKK